MRPMAATFLLAMLAGLGAPLAAQATDHPPHHYFELGNFPLEWGDTLYDGRILYVTHGSLSADRSNAILMPSWYGGDHHGYDDLMGLDAAIDLDKYFVIVAELFGSGGSSSPSTMPAGSSRSDFPLVTIRDNVNATHRLLTEEFGITHLRAVIGYSMGAQAAFQWAVSYPDFMDVIVPWNGTAKTYAHGVVRLESVLTIITHDPSILAGADTLSLAGTRAWNLHWDSWTQSTEWWRLNREVSRDRIRQFVSREPEQPLNRPMDLLVQGRTWQYHNVGETPGFDGDVEKALASIRARVIYMPTTTDMYFPITDAEYERQFIPNVDFRPILSILGHNAPGTDEERAFLMAAIRDALPSS